MTAYELICITNWMPDHKPCLTKGQHYTACNDPNCNGCQPRKAEVGMVCGSCYYRIQETVPASAPWFDALAGEDRAIQRDPAGGNKPGSQVPIPPVPLTIEELVSYFKSFTGTVEKWVSNRHGAEDAIRFDRAMRSAALNHPIAEVPHTVPRTRCPECELLSLVWNPPQFEGGEVRVTCRNPDCLHEVDQAAFEDLAHIEGATGRPKRINTLEHEQQGSKCLCGQELGPDGLGWINHLRKVLKMEAA